MREFYYRGFEAGKDEAVQQKEQKPAIEQLGGMFNSYDMTKTFAEGQYYVMEHPEKFGLRKPADLSVEWSEEDEKYLNLAINIVASDFGEDSPTVSWLKSLRPQYHGDVTMTEAYKMGKEAGEASHWKSTEEQMEALFNASAAVYSEEEQKALESLYFDLKKL